MLDFDDPCLLFAMRRESAAFLREFRPQQRFPGAPCWARFCGPAWLTVLVLETGVGSAATERALQWALGRPRLERLPYAPKMVLSVGFAGSLKEGLNEGDIVLATEVVDLDGNCWKTTWPEELGPGKWDPPLHQGRLLTAHKIIGDPAEKRTLGGNVGAMAVDMESAAAAKLCRQKEVPFGCLRAISDGVDTALSPRLLGILSAGYVSPLRVLLTAASSPTTAKEMWRMAKRTRLAADRLTKALGELLTLTLPFGAEL